MNMKRCLCGHRTWMASILHIRVSQQWHCWHFGSDYSSWAVLYMFAEWSAASLASPQWHLPQLWQLKMSLDIIKCPLGATLSPVENHCSRGLSWELMGKIARQGTWVDIQFSLEFRWDNSLGGLLKYPLSATLLGILEDSLCSWQGILVVRFIGVKPGSN